MVVIRCVKFKTGMNIKIDISNRACIFIIDFIFQFVVYNTRVNILIQKNVNTVTATPFLVKYKNPYMAVLKIKKKTFIP